MSKTYRRKSSLHSFSGYNFVFESGRLKQIFLEKNSFEWKKEINKFKSDAYESQRNAPKKYLRVLNRSYRKKMNHWTWLGYNKIDFEVCLTKHIRDAAYNYF